MSEQASIDGLKFAREGQRLRGSVPVVQLRRIAEELFERTGDVSYSLEGRFDRNGKPVIDVEVRALLALVCQRCLGHLELELERHSRLVLAAVGESLPSVDTEKFGTETVPVESVANVLDLVEQEVLLGIPLAPAHPAGMCGLPEDQSDRRDASPFSVLAQLKVSSVPNGR
jgi:uncharacterized protein